MQTQAKFWNKMATKYAASPVKDPATYAHTLDRTRAHLRPADAVLEIGCGTGSTALMLGPDVGHILATDISSAMIRIAQDKPAPENVTFQTAIPQDPQVRLHAPFDVVLAFNLLHLIPDAPASLRAVHDLLRPGGLFVSKTPCLQDRNALIRPMVWAMQKLGKAPFVGFLDAQTLDRMIVKAGFEVQVAENHGKEANRFIVAVRP